MAVTSNQLESLISSSAGVPFRQRIEFNMVLTAENVASESAGTPRHAERARFAAQILQNPDQYVNDFAQAVVAQLPLATTNMVTVAGVPNADVDTTDATLANTISAVWNDLIPS